MAPVTLTPEEARVLGCLMEKAVTTPDGYPLSLNSLVTACNQTTNREPVVRYDDNVVEHTLESLREKSLSRRVKSTGQRVVKHRHVADETLAINAGEFAVLGVLLLRGAQTPGELKQRTERWHRFRSLDDVEDVLRRLSERDFTKQLPRRPGQKESRWAQLLCEDPEVAAAPAVPVAVAPVAQPATPAPATLVAPPPVVESTPAVAHSVEVRNPATGEVVRTVAITEPGEIAQKLKRARSAQPAWAARPYEERAARLREFRALLEAELDECAEITTTEMGKPVSQSRNEIRAVLDRIDWNIAHVGDLIAERAVHTGDGFEERVSYEPVGVVAHISAWNYPYFVSLNSIVPALLCGNAVLYKPSELATLTGLRIVDLLHRAGVPVDIVHTVVGLGATGAALAAEEVDMVCFTGSHATGQRVAAAVADRLVRLQLELGGKDAAYVCDDVSDVIAAAMSVAEGAFYNTGQSCSATERVYVHAGIWDDFVDAFVEAAGDYEVGPLARPEAIDVLKEQVQDAVQRGAKVLCGGEPLDRPGNWFAPTVLVDVNDNMKLMRDESFGPIIGLVRVDSDADAVDRMDDTEYGLGAAVYSSDRDRATKILNRLDVGNAYWNTADRSTVRLPWAGRRHSGLGVSMSESGVRTFVREKAWHLFS